VQAVVLKNLRDDPAQQINATLKRPNKKTSKRVNGLRNKHGQRSQALRRFEV